MTETELKFTLDAAEAARLPRLPVLAELRAVPRTRARLVSIYLDTADHALARAGIALRLRRVGRAWVQTAKSNRRAGGAGLFAHDEVEEPAPGGRLRLDGPDPSGVYAAIRAAVGDAPLAPVFETRVERMIERLRAPGGGLVELALDRGEVVAGAASAPILELELELVEGDVGALVALARLLFPAGPLRLATANKAALGYRLARGEATAAPGAPRFAADPEFGPDATVERAARDVLRDCFAQISGNLAAVAAGDAIEGPHQLRVGLRRLRTALAVFGPVLGGPAPAALSEAARDLGRVVGRLRDADVLAEEFVAPAAGLGLGAADHAALAAAVEARRAATRAATRTELAGPAVVGFVLDLLLHVETRGWLVPADHDQTARLAAPLAEVAPALLDKRLKAALKRGRRVEKLDVEALHALRKELKKLRYAAEMLGPIYPAKKVAAYVKPLKALQDAFGSLNDAAMAVEALGGPDAPARDDPAAQRAAGWILGARAAASETDRPRIFRRWADFAAAKPFWR